MSDDGPSERREGGAARRLSTWRRSWRRTWGRLRRWPLEQPADDAGAPPDAPPQDAPPQDARVPDFPPGTPIDRDPWPQDAFPPPEPGTMPGWSPRPPQPTLPDSLTRRFTMRARLILTAVLVVVFGAMLWARLTEAVGVDQTAMFYVGIPAVIAIGVVLLARPRRPVGMALSVTTIAIALAGPLLDEGVVCLVMAAPLLYVGAAAIGWSIGSPKDHPHRALATLPLLLVVLLEGVGGVSFAPREDAGSASAVVAASPDAVAQALAAEPEYGDLEAPLLRLVPFPAPLGATGTGLEVGDAREITFTPRRSLGIGAETTPRTMGLEVVTSEIHDDGGRVVLDVVQDSTLDRWMELRSAEVTWRAVDGGTELTWTLNYRRTYDPSWYFGPVQRYATDLAADYLLETFATTAEQAP